MKPSIFRYLIALSVSAGLAVCIVEVVFPLDIPPAALDALFEHEASVPFALQAVSVVLDLVVLVGLLVSVVGLLLFRRWARTLAFATTLASMATLPLIGVTVQSGWESPLLELSAVSWGAVLACAYWSPLAVRFQKQEATSRPS